MDKNDFYAIFSNRQKNIHQNEDEIKDSIRKSLTISINSFLIDIFGWHFFSNYKDSYIDQIKRNIVDDVLKERKNLYIHGSVGTGKTTLLLYIMKTILNKRMQQQVENLSLDTQELIDGILFFNAVKLSNLLIDYNTDLDIIVNNTYLFIDDLGTERTEHSRFISGLEYIVDYSYRNGFPLLFITSNIPLENLFHGNLIRVADRLRSNTVILDIQGASYR
ncbi:MAG: hypothetical protein QXP36_00315 [Conexivisphaerales archaeon]|uniref:hypothetical protein n=1 Tax=Saccharolobus sp. TaxID=2100761 RepID=UPI003182A6A4